MLDPCNSLKWNTCDVSPSNLRGRCNIVRTILMTKHEVSRNERLLGFDIDSVRTMYSRSVGSISGDTALIIFSLSRSISLSHDTDCSNLISHVIKP
jgi:hypothetical protein